MWYDCEAGDAVVCTGECASQGNANSGEMAVLVSDEGNQAVAGVEEAAFALSVADLLAGSCPTRS